MDDNFNKLGMLCRYLLVYSYANSHFTITKHLTISIELSPSNTERYKENWKIPYLQLYFLCGREWTMSKTAYAEEDRMNPGLRIFSVPSANSCRPS